MGLLSSLMRAWTTPKPPPIRSVDWVSVLADLVPHVAMGVRKSANEVAGLTVSEESLPGVVNELYFLYLHILDRKAFADLDSQEREAFITSVVSAVAHRVATERCPNDYQAVFHDFIDLCGERSGTYGNCRLAAARAEALAGTLFWEASRFVSRAATPDDDDATRDPILILPIYAVMSGHVLAFAKSFLGPGSLA
ncbi:MAG: hypothetical protein LC126_23345 [Bryobacterales bacterium]|nr:hypothetical protein [Bryobacterales bacterium]